MSITLSEQLANALGRADEAPNIALAEKIVKANDTKAIKELISLANHKKTAVRNDAVKVLYEAGYRKPALIEPLLDTFLSLLHHKDNRMKWGCMIAIFTISNSKPELVAKHLTAILEAIDTGSVITRDYGINILCNISKLKKHHGDCMELLLEQIEKAPSNQMPMYAEKTAEVISQPYLKRFEKVLRSRKDVFEIPSKQKRIEKLLKNLKFIPIPLALALASTFI